MVEIVMLKHRSGYGGPNAGAVAALWASCPSARFGLAAGLVRLLWSPVAMIAPDAARAAAAATAVRALCSALAPASRSRSGRPGAAGRTETVTEMTVTPDGSVERRGALSSDRT